MTPHHPRFARLASPSRRGAGQALASCLLACLLALALAPAAMGKGWTVTSIGGRDYVSDENVRDFYRFERFVATGGDRIFQHPTLIMRWKTGSQTLYINNILFSLSFPVVDHGGKAMISTVDLAKLVDPVLRPSYIKKPIKFDTVIIDPGHGAHDTGAKGIYGYEKNYALDMSMRLKAALEKRNFKTRMTRSTDTFLSLGQRVDFANSVGNAIFISIHFNSSGNRSASGIETYALAPQGTSSTNAGGSRSSSFLSGNERDAENIALATAIHAQVIHDLKTTDRGIKRARFNVLRGINKPAILFEGGFVTNSAEGQRIHSEAYREQLANSIADAVVRFHRSVGK